MRSLIDSEDQDAAPSAVVDVGWVCRTTRDDIITICDRPRAMSLDFSVCAAPVRVQEIAPPPREARVAAAAAGSAGVVAGRSSIVTLEKTKRVQAKIRSTACRYARGRDRLQQMSESS